MSEPSADRPHRHESASVTVRDLSVIHGSTTVLHGVDLDLEPGHVHVLLGASGAGKSTVVSALTGMLPAGSRATGTALLRVGDRTLDLLTASPRVQRRRLRGRVVGTAPQGAGGIFTPTSTVGAQLREAQRVAGHRRVRLGAAHPHLPTGAERQLVDLAHAAGVDPAWLARYPHQLSGGQLARLGLVAAMVNHPPVLLADEPTAGLDADASRTVGLLLAAYAQAGHSVLVITHDVALARQVAHTVTRVAAGRVAAQGTPEDVLPGVARPPRRARSASTGAPALAAHGVAAARGAHAVLAPLNLAVRAGEVVGLTGPSGVGKSTAAAILAQLEAPAAGHITLAGQRVAGAGLALPPAQRRRVAWVSQHPRTAVDARMTLRRAIELPARLAGTLVDDGTDLAADLAARVGLDRTLLGRRPHQVSGGELQRAVLARALAVRPEYLVLDEATSMLDEATAAEVLGLVGRVAAGGTGVLLVSHDVTALRAVCDRVLELRPSDGGAVLTPLDDPGSELVPTRPGPTLETTCT
ncbi:ABC transporter ATP-binding protein [Isoptericola variabilis]|uniref:Monosaccharide-transporting ATPase n=1 Tax=Isoptericola variabilis (strain 225) TaxID=743718 RepID=F6FR37_ISOV2|nr:ATP-binding cassette domain-containing protein [Isoptericola variabilis]AEG44987.1 Monosaccharide-transporting ATPase [Isoptericola variabilis 225]TWH26001.1 peptide/nickel transport system ATP-binding protein [Isoptericola variabilis J7]